MHSEDYGGVEVDPGELMLRAMVLVCSEYATQQLHRQEKREQGEGQYS
jgi:hypothetical protein